MRVTRKGWAEGRALSVTHVLGVLIARRAEQVLRREGAFPWATYSDSAAQIAAMRETVGFVFQPLMDIALQDLMTFVEDDDSGFYRWSLATDLTTLEQGVITETLPAADAEGFKRIVYREPFEKYELCIWRARYESDEDTSAQMHGVVVALTDSQEQLAAYALLRAMHLPDSWEENDILLGLASFDCIGLELGHALRELLLDDSIKLSDLLDGAGLLQLVAVEVRQDLRGSDDSKGLGARMLRHSIPLALANLPFVVSKMVTAVQPFQYDYPIDPRLPASFVMEALDAADNLREHLDTQRIQDSVPQMAGTEVLYLATDPRARGSDADRRDLISSLGIPGLAVSNENGPQKFG